MRISTLLRKRFTRVAALALTLAAVTPPAAQASPPNYYEPFSPTAKAFAAPTAEAYAHFYQPFSPTVQAFADYAAPATLDSRALVVPEPTPRFQRDLPCRPSCDPSIDGVSTPAARESSNTAPVALAAPTQGAEGFGWADAGIGFAAGGAIALLLAAAALLVNRRRDGLTQA